MAGGCLPNNGSAIRRLLAGHQAQTLGLHRRVIITISNSLPSSLARMPVASSSEHVLSTVEVVLEELEQWACQLRAELRNWNDRLISCNNSPCSHRLILLVYASLEALDRVAAVETLARACTESRLDLPLPPTPSKKVATSQVSRSSFTAAFLLGMHRRRVSSASLQRHGSGQTLDGGGSGQREASGDAGGVYVSRDLLPNYREEGSRAEGRTVESARGEGGRGRGRDVERERGREKDGTTRLSGLPWRLSGGEGGEGNGGGDTGRTGGAEVLYRSSGRRKGGNLEESVSQPSRWGAGGHVGLAGSSEGGRGGGSKADSSHRSSISFDGLAEGGVDPILAWLEDVREANESFETPELDSGSFEGEGGGSRGGKALQREDSGGSMRELPLSRRGSGRGGGEEWRVLLHALHMFVGQCWSSLRCLEAMSGVGKGSQAHSDEESGDEIQGEGYRRLETLREGNRGVGGGGGAGGGGGRVGWRQGEVQVELAARLQMLCADLERVPRPD
eukprot:TRINITY_DN1354_c0_g2_i1.p1 TRINITY_DN1354_c0_g2~~TRINITY_DN1354_c0_g2_i1.p1  ORF type:complete len:558 (-),score=86.30 TRINITY_DN1354_c0_g2_i1:397-1911(-)